MPGESARLPMALQPTSIEEVHLPIGGTANVPKCTPLFKAWEGTSLPDTYNGKQVLDVQGRPAFAELAILWALEDSGWAGVWIDTYRRAYRTGYWGVPPVAELPKPAAELLAAIYDRAGSRGGAWDVFCWRFGDFLFAESKRRRKDRIRDSQRTWLEAALELGMGLNQFLVVEWGLAPRQVSRHGKSKDPALD
jgi:hypothetical protein